MSLAHAELSCGDEHALYSDIRLLLHRPVHTYITVLYICPNHASLKNQTLLTVSVRNVVCS